MSSENNAEILNQLQFICNKIEESIKQYHENKEQEAFQKQQEEILSNENNNSPSFLHQINSYKSQIATLQNDLEKVYSIDNINSLESQINQKEHTLKELKREKMILNKMVKEQNNGINEYLSKFDSTKETKELQTNLKMVKEENHLNKEAYKGISLKLKSQKTKIEQLEKKCLLIKQNIEFQKKKQLKEIQKNEKEQNQLEDDEENDTDKLNEIEKQLMEEINVQEKTYQNEINSQNDLMKKLRTEIKKIEFKVKNLTQEKKLDQIKKKEELKANKEKARNKSSSKPNRTNINQKNNDQKNLKRGSSNFNTRRNNDYLITNQNYKNRKMQNEINTMLLTPNYRIPKSGKFNKPFEIKKFNKNASLTNNNINDDGKYVTMFNESKKYRLDNANSTNENQSNRNNYQNEIKANKQISSEIESLKNDIQNVLKNNVAVINKINSNEKEKEKENIFSNIELDDKGKEINYDEINIENNINKNNYKKEFCMQNEVNINQYKLDNNNINEKASEEFSKRKPFDKINFSQKQ